MTAVQVSSACVQIISEVRKSLAVAGVMRFVERDCEATVQLRDRLLGWRYREILPFILPEQTETLSNLFEDPLCYLFSGENCALYNHEQLFYVDSGYVVIGSDYGGNPLCIDVRNGDELDVALIYAGAIGRQVLDDKWVVRSGRSITNVFDWFRSDPGGCKGFLD